MLATAGCRVFIRTDWLSATWANGNPLVINNCRHWFAWLATTAAHCARRRIAHQCDITIGLRAAPASRLNCCAAWLLKNATLFHVGCRIFVHGQMLLIVVLETFRVSDLRFLIETEHLSKGRKLVEITFNGIGNSY